MKKVLYELGLIFLLLAICCFVGFGLARIFSEKPAFAIPVGIAVGYVSSISLFYYFTPHFGIFRTILLIVINSVFSAAEFYEVYSTFQMHFQKLSANYLFLALVLPILIIINKYFFDSLMLKLNPRAN
ncbi:MAG TPA: hypothetical protein VK528_04840 [Flavobacterium sp.]|nr:hypothetical protein [Flavobacterium sp.]